MGEVGVVYTPLIPIQKNLENLEKFLKISKFKK
jgi:hypothetical protein